MTLFNCVNCGVVCQDWIACNSCCEKNPELRVCVDDDCETNNKGGGE